MTNKQIVKRYRKREKVMGTWMADRNYDAWEIFIGKSLWTTLYAVTKRPVELMLKDNPFANIDWSTVRAKKLT